MSAVNFCCQSCLDKAIAEHRVYRAALERIAASGHPPAPYVPHPLEMCSRCNQTVEDGCNSDCPCSIARRALDDEGGKG